MSEKAIRKFQKELNSGAVSLVVLGLIRQRNRPTYGYEIAKQLESIADGTLPMKQSALYPVLRSLEKQQLLSSRVEPSVSGPPRKYYQLTAAGRRALEEWKTVWHNTKCFVDTVLENQEHAHRIQGSRSKVSRRT